MARRLVNDSNRPGLNSKDRGHKRVSEFLNNKEELEAAQDEQLKQLKLIKTHMEVLTDESLQLSQNDDDDGGSH